MISNLVIIPTYNEKDNIELLIEDIFDLEVNFHILIVDDNSPDKTYELVENMQKAYPDKLFIIKRKGKLGLGTAYITGFKWALEKKYDNIFEMDADFSHNPNDLVYLYKALAEENADLAIGSRYISGVNVVNWPIGRVLLSYFASAYVRFITRMPIKDTTAGFKGYKNHVLESIELDKIRLVGYAFQIEMKFLTWKMGYKIIEVPIIFTDRKRGSSKMSGGIFNEAVWGVLKMKIKSWFFHYKKKEIKPA